MKNNSEKTPICVDLDGTLIRTDVLQESLYSYLRLNPLRIIFVLMWLLKGRAYLKQQLANRVDLNVELLPVNEALLAYLKEQYEHDVPLFLVTASDQKIAQKIADRFQIFKKTFASNGYINLRSSAKAKFLVDTFGDKDFIYAGNSRHDIAVWKHAKTAITVNTPLYILQFLYESHIETINFFENHFVQSGVVRLINPRFWIKNIIFTFPILISGLLNSQYFLDYCWAFMSFTAVDIWGACFQSFVLFNVDRKKYFATAPEKRHTYALKPLVTGQLYLAQGFQLFLLSSLILLSVFIILENPYDFFITVYALATIAFVPFDLSHYRLRTLRLLILSMIIMSSTLFYFFDI